VAAAAASDGGGGGIGNGGARRGRLLLLLLTSASGCLGRRPSATVDVVLIIKGHRARRPLLLVVADAAVAAAPLAPLAPAPAPAPDADDASILAQRPSIEPAPPIGGGARECRESRLACARD
jgi:hypothetical protein